jgi:hypothetical protein
MKRKRTESEPRWVSVLADCIISRLPNGPEAARQTLAEVEGFIAKGQHDGVFYASHYIMTLLPPKAKDARLALAAVDRLISTEGGARRKKAA